jgi:protein TonB
MGLMPARTVAQLPRRARHARHAAWEAAVRQLDVRVAELERRIARFDQRYAALAIRTRLEVALLFSLLLHVLVILGVTFKMPGASLPNTLHQPLEVVLVNAKSREKPPQADALAQANLDGGGNTDAPRRARSPLPVGPQSKPTPKIAAPPPRVEQPEREAKQLLARSSPEPEVESVPAQAVQPRTDAPPAPSAAEIMQRSLEIARLEAQISKQWDSYQKRPRRKFIGARTQEFRFARYVEDWRLKIERVGELNYPQAARDQRIYGSLVVTVAIKSDGKLEGVEINRPSGFKILDEAALRIVKLAAPFAPFPPDISKDVDILHITRTWTFTRSDQFVTD